MRLIELKGESMFLQVKKSLVAGALVISFVAPVCAQYSISLTAPASETKPDALLQVDLNRNAVVERIIAAWRSDIPAAQIESFREKLRTLRADQLLVANVSGSFDSVLELVGQHELALNRTQVDKTKALGEIDRDLLYTPITPCRLLDTRGVFSPVFAGGAFAPNETRAYQMTGNCSVPLGAQAVVTQIIMITPSAAGDIELLPQGATFGSTAAMVFQANTYSSVSLITKLNQTNGQFATQVRGPGGNVAMDVTGYFMPPNRSGDGLRVTQTAGIHQNAPNIVNGSQANSVGTLSQGTVIAGGGSSNVNCWEFATQTRDRNCRNFGEGIFGTVAGGSANQALGNWDTISGGSSNTSSQRDSSGYNVIGGGSSNSVVGIASTISGGSGNSADASGTTIGGGNGNVASVLNSTIGGGNANQASSAFSTVGGGLQNRAYGYGSVIAGGEDNAAGLSVTRFATDGGFNTVSGGKTNSASGQFSTVPGGHDNTASGRYSFSGGRSSKTETTTVPPTTHHGAFVWSDSNGNNPQTQVFRSTSNDQFAVRSRGGVAFRVAATESADTGAGCSLPAGGAASWVCSSDRNLKESIKSISPHNVLSKVLALPVTSWQFIGTNRRHIGPMAQDFRAAFGLGADDKNITTSDVSGVALAAIQGLNQKLEAEKAKNKAKEAEIAGLKADLALIKKKLGL
jgi:Chaperone of endosialidase